MRAVVCFCFGYSKSDYACSMIGCCLFMHQKVQMEMTFMFKLVGKLYELLPHQSKYWHIHQVLRSSCRNLSSAALIISNLKFHHEHIHHSDCRPNRTVEQEHPLVKHKLRILLLTQLSANLIESNQRLQYIDPDNNVKGRRCTKELTKY